MRSGGEPVDEGKGQSKLEQRQEEDMQLACMKD